MNTGLSEYQISVYQLSYFGHFLFCSSLVIIFYLGLADVLIVNYHEMFLCIIDALVEASMHIVIMTAFPNVPSCGEFPASLKYKR